jgi:hypothetical protein
VAWGERSPLSKTPVLLVTVCVVPSLFFQVTVVPTGAVRVLGVKEKFTMFIISLEAVVGVELVVFVVVLLEQPAKTVVNKDKSNIVRIHFFISIL